MTKDYNQFSGEFSPGKNRIIDFAAIAGSLIFAFMLIYSLFTALPLKGAWNSWFGQIKLDSLLFWSGLFFLILFKPNQSLASLRWLSERIPIKQIIILALILRLGWVILGTVEQRSDFLDFHNMALDILNGKYIIRTNRPTGPSIFFAFLYWIFGVHQLVSTVFLAFLSTLQIWLVYSFVSIISSDKVMACSSALILAVWPDHILFTNLLGSEVLFSFLIFLGLWLLLKSRISENWKISKSFLLCSGLSFGAAHWVRPMTPLFILMVLCFLFLDNKVIIRRFFDPFCFFIGLMILVAPMMICNKKLIGKASPSPSQIRGWSMLVGTNIASRGRYTQEDENYVSREMANFTPGSNENPALFRDRVAMALALKRLKENPGAFIEMVLMYKFAALWGKGEELGWSIPDTNLIYWPMSYLDRLYHMLIVVIASSALFRRCRPIFSKSNVVTVFIYSAILTAAAHIFLETKPRYNFMFLPLLAICAAALIASIKSAPKNSLQPAENLNHRTKSRRH